MQVFPFCLGNLKRDPWEGRGRVGECLWKECYSWEHVQASMWMIKTVYEPFKVYVILVYESLLNL